MLSERPVTCPPGLLEAVAGLPQLRTGIVNAVSPVVLESARDALHAGIIEPVLFGAKAGIRKASEAIGWDISDIELIQADGEQAATATAAEAAGRGGLGAVMKGHVHTDIFMRGLLQREAGLRTGQRLAHVFHMSVPDSERALLISDAALNTHPDQETAQAIIANTVTLAHAIGLERPQIALLSATEEKLEAVPSSIAAAELTEWAGAGGIENADVYGPLSFDLAVSPGAVAIKGVDFPVAGRADALIVPDIVTGNALYKMMVYFMGACAAGIVLGAKVPILLTSRADPPAARIASAALAVIVNNHASR